MGKKSSKNFPIISQFVGKNRQKIRIFRKSLMMKRFSHDMSLKVKLPIPNFGQNRNLSRDLLTGIRTPRHKRKWILPHKIQYPALIVFLKI